MKVLAHDHGRLEENEIFTTVKTVSPRFDTK